MSEHNHFYLKTKLFFTNHFGKNYQFGCGHKGKLVGKIRAFGEENIYDLSDRLEYCHECLAKMSIQCFVCKKVIMVGDGVTIAIPNEDYLKLPGHGVVHDTNPLQVVACFRHTDSFIDLAGQWMPPGKIEKFSFL